MSRVVLPVVLAGMMAVAAGCTPSTPVEESREAVVAPAGAPAVLLVAGDIADCEGQADATAALLDDHEGVVAAVGDLAYPRGTPEDFARCYDPTWGRVRDRTRPALGNHDVAGGDAQGYFGYFDDGAVGPRPGGYYGYALGNWHVVVLNSTCALAGGCGPDSDQVRWLRDELAAAETDNILAYWHHPRFSTGQHGDTPAVETLWTVVAKAGADVVVAAHDHDYQRFAPLDADGEPAPDGVRQFVVGTGGAELRSFTSTSPHVQFRQAQHAGVLRLELSACGYTWAFLAVGEQAPIDEGQQTATC